MFREDPVWTWNGVPRSPGPTVCVDIDGVLADASHRQFFLDYHDWDSFFMAVGDDPVLAPQAAAIGLFDAEHVIALVTSRPQWVSDLTTGWLRWSMVVAAVLLPLFAVIIANAVKPRALNVAINQPGMPPSRHLGG